MGKKITVTKYYIQSLKNRIKDLETNIEQMRSDRQKHRDFYVSTLKTAIEIHGKSQYWSMQSLIERLAKHLNNVESWYWG